MHRVVWREWRKALGERSDLTIGAREAGVTAAPNEYGRRLEVMRFIAARVSRSVVASPGRCAEGNVWRGVEGRFMVIIMAWLDDNGCPALHRVRTSGNALRCGDDGGGLEQAPCRSLGRRLCKAAFELTAL
jgi:hypothetical protein